MRRYQNALSYTYNRVAKVNFQHRLYQGVISKGEEFVDQIREYENTIAHEDSVELREKGLAVLTFQFEAAMQTRQWNLAEQLLQV